MIYLEAPNPIKEEDKTKTKVFLGGGITDCPNWQKEATEMLEDKDIVIFNPRREDFDVNNHDIENEQINWEFNYLRKSDIIIFWFPEETLCPITLFELGAHLQRDVKILIGTHKNYGRRSDVIIQSKLVRGDIVVHASIEDLIKELNSNLESN